MSFLNILKKFGGIVEQDLTIFQINVSQRWDDHCNDLLIINMLYQLNVLLDALEFWFIHKFNFDG